MTDNSEWISVNDKLPEHNQVVLALWDTAGYDWYKYPTNLTLLNFYAPNQFVRYFREKESLHQVNSVKVTHWMPIPPPL